MLHTSCFMLQLLVGGAGLGDAESMQWWGSSTEEADGGETGGGRRGEGGAYQQLCRGSKQLLLTLWWLSFRPWARGNDDC